MTVQQRETCTFVGLSSFFHLFSSFLIILAIFIGKWWKNDENDENDEKLKKNDEKMMTVQQNEIGTFAGLSSFSHHFPSFLQ